VTLKPKALGLLAAAFVCMGVVSLWRGIDSPGPVNTELVTPELREAEVLATPQPVALPDAESYAATRLKEIKTDPETWTDVWKWRREFSSADTPDLQREVVGLARQVGADPMLAILAQALASDDAVVRLDAARSIALLPDARMPDGFAIGLASPHADTRREVLDLIDQVQPHLRPAFLRAALLAPDAGIQQQAIAQLRERPSPETFAVLLDGLHAASGDTRAQLDRAITEMCGEPLRDATAATRWWAANRERFDETMTRIR
jgi:hypothetical protein